MVLFAFYFAFLFKSNMVNRDSKKKSFFNIIYRSLEIFRKYIWTINVFQYRSISKVQLRKKFVEIIVQYVPWPWFIIKSKRLYFFHTKPKSYKSHLKPLVLYFLYIFLFFQQYFYSDVNQKECWILRSSNSISKFMTKFMKLDTAFAITQETDKTV